MDPRERFFNPNPDQKRGFLDLNPTGGSGYDTISPVGGQFNPVNPQSNIPTNIDRGPFPDGAVYNPYGITQRQDKYGKSAIYGGAKDLMKSVATRSMVINALMDEFTQRGDTGGLEALLAGAADQSGDPLLSEAFSNASPEIGTRQYLQDLAYENQLTELLGAAYLQGGQLFGGQLQAEAQAKAIDKARRARSTGQIQGIIGGLAKGLGVGMVGDIASGAIGVAQ